MKSPRAWLEVALGATSATVLFVMMMITAMILATGPWTESRTCCNGSSQGMPEPAAKAAPAPKAEKTEKKTKSAKPKAAAKPKSRAKTKSKE